MANGSGGAITDFFLQLGFDTSQVNQGLNNLATQLQNFSTKHNINVGVNTTGSQSLNATKGQIDNLIIALEKAQSDAVHKFGASWEKLNNETLNSGAFKNMKKSLNEVEGALAILRSGATLTTAQLQDYKNTLLSAKNNSTALLRENSQLNKTFRTQTFIVNSLKDSIKNLARSWLSAFAIIKGGKEFTQIGQGIMAARASLRMISDDLAEADAHFEFVTHSAKRLGIELEDATRNFARFGIAAKKAGLTLDDTKEIFLGVAEATRAYHMSNEQTLLTYRAFDQMLSRGVVSMEEVRKQLGNNMPAAFYTAAEAMGYTDKQFDNLVVNGKVKSKEFVQAFSRHLRHIVRENGTLQASLTTSQAAMQKFHQSWKTVVASTFEQSMDNSLFNFFTAFADLIDRSEPQIQFLASTFSFIIDVVTALIRLFQIMINSLNASAQLVRKMTNNFWGMGDAIKRVFRFISQEILHLTIATDKWKEGFADGSASIGDYAAAIALSIGGISTAIYLAIKAFTKFRNIISKVKGWGQKLGLAEPDGEGKNKSKKGKNRSGKIKSNLKRVSKRVAPIAIALTFGGIMEKMIKDSDWFKAYENLELFKGIKEANSLLNMADTFKDASSGVTPSNVNNISFDINGVTDPEEVALVVERKLDLVFKNSLSVGAM